MNPVTTEIVSWLTDACGKGRPDVRIEPDSPLLESGLLDSLHLLRLVDHVEQRWGVSLVESDLVPGNFQTPAMIARLVQSRSR